VSTVSAALEAARSEVSELSAALDAEKRRAEEATRAAARAEEQMRAASSSASALRGQLKEVGRYPGHVAAVQEKLVLPAAMASVELARDQKDMPCYPC